MEFIRGLHNIRPHHKGCILTIGNFDGFHLGHQALLGKLQEEGRSYNVPIMVMLFEPQPREYLSHIMTIRLTKLRDKVNYLFEAGVDIILCIKFNKRFASIEAHNFIKNILVRRLGVQFVCVGDDFRFGALRKGDFFYLKKIGEKSGLQVIRAHTYFDKQGKKVSSTAIRIALMEDRIVDAESLLGHAYCVSGRVIYGDAFGRTLGFPTANISLQGKRLPVHGVYAVSVYGIADEPLPGIANIGIRPTISGATQQKLEVHLLNVSINLYTCHIKVAFLAKIRDEKCFDSIKTLRSQIKSDVQRVYNYFRSLF